jgi:hypothetical protein
MHPPPNNRTQPLPMQLPSPPPPDDMDFNGEDNPGPYEPIQQILRHPILNGISFTSAFLFYFLPSLL